MVDPLLDIGLVQRRILQDFDDTFVDFNLWHIRGDNALFQPPRGGISEPTEWNVWVGSYFTYLDDEPVTIGTTARGRYRSQFNIALHAYLDHGTRYSMNVATSIVNRYRRVQMQVNIGGPIAYARFIRSQIVATFRSGSWWRTEIASEFYVDHRIQAIVNP